MKKLLKNFCVVLLAFCVCLTSVWITPVSTYNVNAAATYAVRYNANGGTNAPASQTKYQNKTLKLSTQKPTKTGYTFLGWTTSSSSRNVVYQPGANYTANSAITLYAVWTPLTYTIQYSANGGTGAPSAQTKQYGISIKISTKAPTKSGYTFLGWSTSPSATTPMYAPGATYSNNANAYLYAVYKQNSVTYTITYNVNGGTTTPARQTKTTGQTIKLSTIRPTRSGYTFQGWSTAPSGNVIYQPGASYSKDASVILYAIWKGNTYTITYNANGGTGAPSSQTKTHGTTLKLSTTKPTRYGYTFVGWATSSTATTSTYLPGSNYTTEANMTLYAVWKINTYTVTYNANGGTGAPASQTKNHGSSITLSSTKPSRAGYSFQGWGTSSSATVSAYGPGSVYSNNQSITLYAIWSAQSYTISYSANGGTGAPASQTKNHGSSVTLSSTVPTRTGYSFQGWGTSSTATSIAYKAGATYSNNQSITLYAIWGTATYTVSYNANGGTNAPTSQKKTYNVSLTLSTSKPTRSGYTFLGWATSSTATTASYQPGAVYTANQNVTLYAVWKINTYTITYNANGGTGAPTSQTKTHGTSITLSSTKPTRTGYTFQGWGTSSTATAVAYGAGATYSNNQSITLYAVWSALTYKVTYNANGGTNAPATQTKSYNTSLTLSSSKPTRTGYTFQGWATTSTGSVAYKPGAIYSTNANLTLYAIWTINTYTITYNANGGTGAPASQTKTYGQSITLSSQTLTRSGYTFKGWSKDKSAFAADYEKGATFTENANVTLYAVWRENVVYTAEAKNYLEDMAISIPCIAEYNGKNNADGILATKVQFYLYTLGYSLGNGGFYRTGIDSVMSDTTLNKVKSLVGTTDLNVAVPLLEDKLVPVLNERAKEWKRIVDNSKSLLSKTAYTLEDPKFLVFFRDEGEDHVDPIFQGRLANFGKNTGIPVFCFEGFRSYELQQQRYEQYGPGKAAKPGNSWHEFGEAVDIDSVSISCTRKMKEELGGATAATSSQTYFTKYGIFKPLTTGNGTKEEYKENWHFQPYSETEKSVFSQSGKTKADFYEAWSGLQYEGNK